MSLFSRNLGHTSLALTLYLAILTAPCQAGSGPGRSNDFGGKRVLVIGIDGCRPDALQRAVQEGMAPHLKQLIDGGTVSWTAVAGGQLGTPTEQPTISGPGWGSICTGVWTDRHGLVDNTKPPLDRPDQPGSYQLSKSPHFARYLKAAFPSCSIHSLTSWDWIEDYLVAAQPQYFDRHLKGTGKNYPLRDESVKQQTVAALGTTDPDVIFLHFDQVDGAGHATGFFPGNLTYLRAISRVDGLIGQVQAALNARARATEESWLTVVTTDHGGLDKSHGKQSVEESTIFFLTHGTGVPAGVISSESPGHTAVPPTVFRYLGVPAQAAWGWASPAFPAP